MFQFGRGAFFSGQLDYRIENLHFSMKAYNAFHYMQRFEFDITDDEELREIGAMLTPVKDWTAEYNNNEGILDGFGWDIEYCHNGIMLKSSGYEEYPKNYNEVVAELQEYMEKLCKKYSSDKYKEEEAKERIKL